MQRLGLISLHKIDPQIFDHGLTRTLAGKNVDSDILIYLTQDVVPVDEFAIENLVSPLTKDRLVAISYGRQIPYPDATPFAKHLRLFNYPKRSTVKTLNDKTFLGIKTAFLSNSFAAYRRSCLEEIGWFKSGLIFGEDTHAGARLLKRGYKIAYMAEARVYHSHNYTIKEEFQRYFDIGVFHTEEQWLLKDFGKAEGEGIRYIKSALNYLKKEKLYHLLPELILRTLLKFIAYRLGRIYKILPWPLCKQFSMNKKWWERMERSNRPHYFL